MTWELQGSSEGSVLAVTKVVVKKWDKRESKEEKMKKKCEHCFMRGHVRDECFKLVGYPDWFTKPKGKNNSANLNNNSASGNFRGNTRAAMNVSKQTSDDVMDSPLEKKM